MMSTDGSVDDDTASAVGADDTAANATDTSMTSLSRTTSGGGSSGGNAVKFMLVTRRVNKQHFSSLDVPASDQLAAKYRQREEVSTSTCPSAINWRPSTVSVRR